MRTVTSRTLRGVIAALTAVLVTLVPGAVLASSGDGSSGDASSGGAPPVTANEFIPEDRDLSECLSSIPKPDCGSEARGGWRQGVVLGLVMLGMAAIGARIFVAVRRRDAALTAAAERDDTVSPTP